MGIAGRDLLREAVARLRDGRWLVALIALAVLAGAIVIAGRIASSQAADNLRDGALAALPLAAGTLTGEIEKQRLVPLVLARDDAVREALRRAGKTEETALDDKLKAIAGDASASAIYVIDTAGIAISASNAGEPASFVGIDYNFRHYFNEAMAKGAASQYGLGTISGRPSASMCQPSWSFHSLGALSFHFAGRRSSQRCSTSMLWSSAEIMRTPAGGRQLSAGTRRSVGMGIRSKFMRAPPRGNEHGVSSEKHSPFNYDA